MYPPEILTLQQAAQIITDAGPRTQHWQDAAAEQLRVQLGALATELQRIERVVWVTSAVERVLGV